VATRLKLLLLAFFIGGAVGGGESALYAALTHHPWSVSSDLDFWTVPIIATPYIVLALLPARRILPWAIALTLTLSLWSYWLYSTVSYNLHPDGSGVDMGGALLLLSSPLVISAIALGAHFAQQEQSRTFTHPRPHNPPGSARRL
jgi:hypothetical protein